LVDAKAFFLCEGRPVNAALGQEKGRLTSVRRASGEGREGIAARLAKRPLAWRQD